MSISLKQHGLFLTCIAVCLSSSFAESPAIHRSGDDWVLDTGVVRKTIRVAAGRVLLVSFRSVASGHEFVSASQSSPEIRLTADGHTITGADIGWTLAGSEIREVRPGQSQLDLRLRRGAVEIIKHYLVYAHTPIIREWVSIRNSGARPIKIEEPHFLACNLMADETATLDLYYITGGGNYNGSQLLKTERLTPGYTRVFDSKIGIQTASYSAYLPLIALRNRDTQEGIMAGWDYMGHWALHVGEDRPNGVRGDLSLKVAGYGKVLAPGASLETPKAFVGAFRGDIDALGNSLLDWQYEHLWDYTNDAYFARTRWAVDWPDPWVGNGGKPSGDNWGRRLVLDLRYIDLMRETGTEILWDDAGWYDQWGSWQGPDWRLTTDFARKHGMNWVLWFPTFLATPGSFVAQEHPDWLIRGTGHFEQSLRATAQWQYDLLAASVRDWGDFQWRYDIAPAVSANDTDYLDSDQNFRWLLEKFKSTYPHSGVDACYGGGRWISYDLARFAESGEYTDGGVGPYSSYYTSLIIPPDKYHNVSDFDHTLYRSGSDRIHLSMDPTWYRDPGDGPDLEAIRQNWDLYRYLRAQGVVGRWSHVFRPAVDNDDPIWYFQRMNREGSRGVILTKHAHTAPVYLLLAKRISGGGQDTYRGGPWNMCLVSTENAAAVDTGVYQDPVDGEPRFYGTTGEVYGPVNFKFSRNGSEVPYIRQIIKRGAVQPAKDQFFGMAIQPAGEPLIVTQLGLNGLGKHEWDSTTNKGKYRITIMRANDRKAVASAEIDMARGEADRLGFKYVKLKTPVRLDPTPGKPVVIRPRGLLPTASYDVRFAKSGDRATRRGADLMEKGIELESVLPGEILFLNLPKHPGAGTDSVPPSAPAGVTKSMGTNLGVQGIEVRWKPATDDNWISYYEILRDGQPQARAAIGNFYFDHTGEPARLIAAKYEVRAVDGDGNRSAVSLAASIAGDPPTYRALGGFAPTQGAAQWRYEEHLEDGSVRELRWEHTGYEGLWTGSGLARVGRIWMQSGRHSDVARVFVVPQAGTASIEGYLRKDPSAENHHIARAKVLHNGSQLWPPSGWTEVPPDSRKRVECRIPAVPVRAGDTLRFILEKTGEELPDPVVWDPIIVLSESSRMLKNGISQPLPWRKPQGMRIVMSR